MFNKILGFHSTGNFIKAYEIINNELNQSFDLSNEAEREKFEKLHELRDNVFLSLADDKYSNANENYRSSSSSEQVNVRAGYNDYKYLEYLGEIAEQRILTINKGSKDIDSAPLNSTIVNVLLSPPKIKSNDDCIFTNLSEAGLYIDDPNYEGYDLLYLRGYSKDNEINIKRALDGLNNIFNGLVEDKKQTLVISFLLDQNSISEPILFLTLFASLTSMVFSIINAEAQSGISIKVYWAFDEESVTDLFRKVIIKAKVIKALPQYLDGILSRLKNRALTKNEEYIKQLRSIAHIINEVDVPILLVGETGVGKSFLANIIHEEDLRDGKFVSLNCGNIPDQLIESELFGIKPGTATDVKGRTGKIAAAEKGTLFLDEIDRASKKVRDVLLTFLDTKKYSLVGSNDVIHADVRLIYGSNKDFQKLISQNEFEDDFLSRINERIIKIPPLRNRPEDVEGIVRNILNELNNRKESNIDISPDVIAMMSKLPLKGNNRDLNKIVKYGFYESLYKDKYGIISLRQYDNYSFSNDYDLIEIFQLLDLSKVLMLKYDFLKERIPGSNGKEFDMMKDLVMPIFAHVFLNEIYEEKNELLKTNCALISGSSLGRGNEATIFKRSEKFNEIQKTLKVKS